MTNEASKTPRTDREAIGFARILVDRDNFKVTELVQSDFARQLETELNAEVAKNEQWGLLYAEERQRLRAVEKERDQAIAQRDALLSELKNIANANPNKWEVDMRDQFQPWAQNRARHAIASIESTTAVKGEG